jgi:hypothetical protein
MRWDNATAIAVGVLITSTTTRVVAAPSKRQRFRWSWAPRTFARDKGGSDVELEPANWKPLELLIGSRCGEFMWMWRENGLEYYKHIDSRRYLILDAEGRCYSRQEQLVRVDFQEELRRVTESISV